MFNMLSKVVDLMVCLESYMIDTKFLAVCICKKCERGIVQLLYHSDDSGVKINKLMGLRVCVMEEEINCIICQAEGINDAV